MLNNIEVVILAGGRGSRMQEITSEIPKPMTQVGNKPILWHLMKIFYHQNFTNFNIALGYKGEIIKEYFLNYEKYFSSLEISFLPKKINYIDNILEDWKIKLIDTGLNSETGSRLFKMRNHIVGDNFFFTYGDGLADVDLKELYDFHVKHGKIATVTSVRPPSRFGSLNITNNKLVSNFTEKPGKDLNKINGGFFVLNKKIFDYIDDDDQCIFERKPLELLTKNNQLLAYNHDGFWQCMDTIKDWDTLNVIWKENKAPWKNW
jgi:glucose-1-phosphate cytidylyltransferase